jgi:signal transduction histidine kinase
MPSSLNQVQELLASAEALLQTDASQTLENALMAIRLLKTESADTNLAPLASAYFLAAQAYRNLGKLQQALDYLLLAEEQFAELDDKAQLLQVSRIASFVYADLGHSEKAIAYTLKRLNFAEILGDKNSIAYANNQLGYIHAKYGDSERAIYYYRQSIDYAEANSDNPLTIVPPLTNLSELYYNLGNYQEALQYGLKALNTYQKHELKDGAISIYDALARIYSKLHEREKAFEYGQIILELSKAATNSAQHWEIYSLLTYGNLYLEIDSPQESLLYFHRALVFAEKQSIIRAMRDVHNALATAYKMLGQYQEALLHHEKFHHYHSQMFNQQSDQQLRNLEIIHRTSEAQAEIERQKELREQEKQNFENLSRLQQHFVRSASHDIKTPLASIPLSLHLLAQHPNFHPSLQRYVDRIASATEKMKNLVLNVLDLAKLDMKGAIKAEKLNLDDLLNKIIEEYTEVAENKAIRLHKDFKTEDTIAFLDRQQMMQAIGNLVSNAIKYTKAGGEVFLISELLQDSISIKVKDTGIGIPAEALPHIFEPFYRVPSSAQEADGTGLGLHICYRIVEQHQGKLEVESVVGEGTSFSIHLPKSA